MTKTALNTFIATIIFMLFTGYSAQAQFLSCGTRVTAEQVALENSFVPVDSVHNLHKTFPVAVYIVKNQAGNTGYSEAQLNTVLGELNQNFKPSGLQFSACSIQVVDNYNYDIINPDNLSELTALYFKPHVINLYIVSELYDADYVPVCGLTWMPEANKNVILIRKDCSLTASLTHQMGHFFGLYHTHEEAFGKSKADDSDCATTGDFCCDTPAQPILSGKVDATCIYTAAETDTDGNYYVPSVKNFMSLGRPECQCSFTHDQYVRMTNVFLKYKKDLW
ncbi:MAG TPA: M43 family zinc metalloprotease [Bacteroidales bacterium]|nr:M43 family zinc metalloprotease [Bacteroidales bacterium]